MREVVHSLIEMVAHQKEPLQKNLLVGDMLTREEFDTTKIEKDVAKVHFLQKLF